MSNKKYYIGKYGDTSGQWYVAWQDVEGNWHDAGFDTKEQAEGWLAYGNEGKELDVEYKDGIL